MKLNAHTSSTETQTCFPGMFLQEQQPPGHVAESLACPLLGGWGRMQSDEGIETRAVLAR